VARTDALRTNLLAWEATMRRHRRHRGDEAARLAAGDDPPDLTAVDGALARATRDFADRDVLHLLCNHGDVSVALARRARSVLGVDFSAEAVAEARDLARATRSGARFVRAEAMRFLARTTRRFDAAVAAWGVTCWIPDVRAFARGVARVLRPGGVFVLVDGHPMANTAFGVGDADDGYFPDPEGRPRRERWTIDYVGAGHGAPVAIAWWQWPVGDVVTALAEAGLVLESLREFPGTHPAFWGSQVEVEVEGTSAFLSGRGGLLPLSFAVRARKPRGRR
jgi:SAM-dependent methyltransferase